MWKQPKLCHACANNTVVCVCAVPCSWAPDPEHNNEYLPVDPVEKAAELAKRVSKLAPPPPKDPGFAPPS